MPSDDRDAVDIFLYGLWEFIMAFGGALVQTAEVLIKSMLESLSYIMKIMFGEVKKSWKNGKR